MDIGSIAIVLNYFVTVLSVDLLFTFIRLIESEITLRFLCFLFA